MTKPMYCPMSFNNSDERGAWQECTPDCAWAIIPYPNNSKGEIYGCAIALEKFNPISCNMRLLEDDTE